MLITIIFTCVFNYEILMSYHVALYYFTFCAVLASFFKFNSVGYVFNISVAYCILLMFFILLFWSISANLFDFDLGNIATHYYFLLNSYMNLYYEL